MNTQLVLQGLIEIGISLLTGLIIFFTSFKVFTVLTRDIDELAELKKNNTAIAILVSSFVFGIMLLVKSAINPAMDTLGFTMSIRNVSMSVIGFSIMRIVMLYIIAAVFSFIVLWLSIKLFMMLTTEIDEMKEIKNNNSAISIVIAVLIISLAIILSKPLTTLLNGLVSPPVISGSLKQPLINMVVFLQGLIELGISIIAAIFIFFFGFKVFSLLTKNIDEMAELKRNNIAISILVSSFIFAMMLLIKSALVPATETLGFALESNAASNAILFAALRIVLFFVLAAVFAFVMLWLAMKAFMILTTTLDEMEEIKNKNIAVSIIVGVLVISASLLLEHGLTALLSGLVKAPEIGRGLLDLSNFK